MKMGKMLQNRTEQNRVILSFLGFYLAIKARIAEI